MAKVEEPLQKVKENTHGKEAREERETQDDLSGAGGTTQHDGEATTNGSCEIECHRKNKRHLGT